jgi:hypothetical protein
MIRPLLLAMIVVVEVEVAPVWSGDSIGTAMECSTRRNWKECPRRCDAGSAKPMPTVMVPSPVKN